MQSQQSQQFLTTYIKGLSWPESPLHVVEHDLRGAKLHDHIWLMVVVRIDEVERYWNEIRASVIELRSHVDLRVAGISTGKLDDFDASMEIEGYKVAGRLAGLVSHEGINLVRPWIAIVNVVPGD